MRNTHTARPAAAICAELSPATASGFAGHYPRFIIALSTSMKNDAHIVEARAGVFITVRVTSAGLKWRTPRSVSMTMSFRRIRSSLRFRPAAATNPHFTLHHFHADANSISNLEAVRFRRSIVFVAIALSRRDYIGLSSTSRWRCRRHVVGLERHASVSDAEYPRQRCRASLACHIESFAQCLARRMSQPGSSGCIGTPRYHRRCAPAASTAALMEVDMTTISIEA